MSSPTEQQQGREPVRAIPVRRPGRWIAAVIVVGLAALLVRSIIVNPNFRWPIVGQYLFNDGVLRGLQNTLILTALSMVIGVVGGVLLAVMRLSTNPLTSGAAGLYIWLFRGTPLITQLVFWNYLAALYPRLGIGIPFGPEFVGWDTNDLIKPFMAALLGLGLNEAAYMAEIVRGGIQSVDDGQNEAAGALGMTRGQTLRRIVLPQAMRVIIPPTGNQVISMLKTTSLVVAIGYYDLMVAVQQIGARTYQIIPLLIVAALWYLFCTTLLSLVQRQIEKRFARGTAQGVTDEVGWASRMFGFRVRRKQEGPPA